jgi:threonine dehydratase
MSTQFINQVKDSKKRLDKVILNTPLSFAPKLSEKVNANIYLKKENLQKTGSFKLRGAFNKISLLSDEQKRQGIIASSAGNHAQGVAFSASYFDIDAIIVMPESTPLNKINGVKEFGANVVLYGNNYDEAYNRAIELSKEKNLVFIHPFGDEDVIVGQSTIALDILDSFDGKGDIDKIIVPIGGGGLISGIARVFKEISPSTKIIGVSAKGAPAMRESFLQKKIINTNTVKTIADGIAVSKTNELTYNYILENVDDIVEVSDDEIAYAILFLLEQQKVLVEGAGAVGVASLLLDKIDINKDENIVCLLSGGNIDVTMLSVIIEKGLALSYRNMKLVITLVDKPGSLQYLTQVLKENNANIIQISYDRTSVHLDYGDANVSVYLETKGIDHQESIKSALSKANFAYTQL